MLRKLYYRLCFLSYASIFVGQIKLMLVSMHACGGFKIKKIWGFEFIRSKFRIERIKDGLYIIEGIILVASRTS
jgi:hypothetical protein